MAELTHIDERGQLRMVDISDKKRSVRRACARAELLMQPETLRALRGDALPKGEALACARMAGISAAKRTAELIPLCHGIALSWIDVRFELEEPRRLVVTAEAKARDATGVEMEALTAATIASLTIYDMCKAIDRAVVIQSVRLVSKSGGQSGDFVAQPEEVRR